MQLLRCSGRSIERLQCRPAIARVLPGAGHGGQCRYAHPAHRIRALVPHRARSTVPQRTSTNTLTRNRTKISRISCSIGSTLHTGLTSRQEFSRRQMWHHAGSVNAVLNPRVRAINAASAWPASGAGWPRSLPPSRPAQTGRPRPASRGRGTESPLSRTHRPPGIPSGSPRSAGRSRA